MSNSINQVKSILLIIPYGSVGGMERLALTFYDYYKSKGYEVKALKFIKLDSDIINFGKDELFWESNDFNTMSPFLRYMFYLKAPLRLRKIIVKFKITHSIAFGDMANLFSSLTYTSEFKIGSIHALKSIELSTPSLFNKLTLKGYRSTYKKFDKLVCISKSIKADIVENCHYKFSNLEVIYNPHDIERILVLGNEKIEDAFEDNLFKSKTILFLGRLSIQKAPWHLIKAFKIVLQKKPDLKLIFIGDGDPQVQKYIKGLVENLNLQESIFFLGRKSNPYKYLKKSSCLALTSYYEGTPNVIVESIALDTPVISSFCTDGILELMSVDTNAAYDDKDLFKVDGGIISPNFYKGNLSIPKSFDQKPSEIEEIFASGLDKILQCKENGENLPNQREKLLEKFELGRIAKEYLT